MKKILYELANGVYDMSVVIDPTNKRFILSGPFDEEMPHYYIMISDIDYWLKNEEKIHSWMDANLTRGKEHHQGMVITLEDERDVMLFMLRWN